MFGKMKDRAAGAAAAGMAAASQAATKAAKTAKYGVAVARDAAFGSSDKPVPPRSPQGGGYAEQRFDEDDEEMELQRALAASMKTAAQEERTRGAEAPRQAPSQVPRKPPGLEMLMEMGFEESLVRIALQASNGDVEAALAQLCADREDLEGAGSDGSSVGTPTHGGQKRAALEAAEKRAAEARNNAGTMDDWRQEQRRQAASRAPAVAPVPPVPARDAAVEGSAVSAVSAPEPARNDGDPEDWMLQQALAASLEPPTDPKEAQEDPELLDLQLRQAMPEEELDLQMALSASLHTEADPSCAGAAVGEEAEQEEERVRLSASAQQHLSQEQEKLPEDKEVKVAEAVAEALPRPDASPEEASRTPAGA